MRFNTLPKIRILVSSTDAVVAKLEAVKRAAESDKNSIVQVGYTQKYAVYVHEIPARHAQGKTDKYLEIPARQYRYELTDIVRRTYRRTKSLRQGLLLAGLRLQRESQKIVPIDTGALRASAWTASIEDAAVASTAAFMRGQAIREATLASRAKRREKRSSRLRLKQSKKSQRALKKILAAKQKGVKRRDRKRKPK